MVTARNKPYYENENRDGKARQSRKVGVKLMPRQRMECPAGRASSRHLWDIGARPSW